MPPVGRPAGSKDKAPRKNRRATELQNKRDRAAHSMRRSSNLAAFWGGSQSVSSAAGVSSAASANDAPMHDVSAGPNAPPPGGAPAADPPQNQSAGAPMGQSPENGGGQQQDEPVEETEDDAGEAGEERDANDNAPETGRTDPSRQDNVEDATIDADDEDIQDSPMKTFLAAVAERLQAELKTSGALTDNWLLTGRQRCKRCKLVSA